MKYIQRLVLTLSVLVAGFFGSAALAQGATAGADPRLQDMVLGKADAPVTIIEYASLTCPHCAHFHTDVLPAIKKDYIDTGKVKLIYRDFPLDQLAFAGSVLARCGGPEKYFTFLNVLFTQQRQWAGSSDPKTALVQIGRLGGVSSDQFEKCLGDKPLGDYILNSRLEGNQKHNVTSTPTLIINGKTESGAPSLEELRKKLDALVK
jgi:protein-disulfide isomerase